MAFVQPTYILPVSIWRSASDPLTAPPDVTAIGNLSPGKIVSDTIDQVGFSTDIHGHMWLRLPPNTDIQDSANGIGFDICEVPAGTGRFYEVVHVDDIGGGFANEHRFALLSKSGIAPWPTPFPGCGGTIPVLTFAFLTESGDRIALETSGILRLE